MEDNSPHWKLFSKAVKKVKRDEFARYFELKQLLADADTDRELFRKHFATYYRLRIGGLTEAFLKRYFELLFECQPIGQADPHSPLLLDLYRFERRQGGKSIQASFVTKLVAMHDESRPIYDRHVSHFFGLGVPAVGSVEFRIAGFVANLRRIQDSYENWGANPRFAELKQGLCRKQAQVHDCAPARVFDFLVWTVGTHKLK